jgi:hypothetical protein
MAGGSSALERTFAHLAAGPAGRGFADPAEGRAGPTAVRVDQGSRGARRVSGGLYDEGSPLTYISHKALTGIARIREPKGNV